ncbi:MAG: transcriptional regulator [Planctomycetales bacterium]|nr:transcriptional regulator [Planctomycetales bacterium]
MPKPVKRGPDPRTRRRLLELLKMDGPRDATALARRLGVTPMAVRQHLYALEAETLVESETARRPLGRPARLWRLTRAADAYFPNAHADLTVSLIDSVRAAFGEPGLDRLITIRTRRQVEAYRAEVPRTGPLRRRVEALARIRAREGYLAEVRTDEDGALLLIENHCPICVAAASCTNLCSGELAVFREILGPSVRIERAEHILAGARRCAYRVARAAGPAR